MSPDVLRHQEIMQKRAARHSATRPVGSYLQMQRWRHGRRMVSRGSVRQATHGSSCQFSIPNTWGGRVPWAVAAEVFFPYICRECPVGLRASSVA